MPSVSVIINGKNYRMACDEGQEAHLEDLAAKFDGYVTHLKGSFGDIGDQRLVVMAAIMVTDEMLELERRAEQLETQLATVKNEAESKMKAHQSGDGELAKLISDAAEKIEIINRKIAEG